MPNNAIPMTVMDNSTAVQLQATEGISVDVSGKADKVTGATSGNFAGLDAHGNLTDSGKKASDFLTAHQDISGKANLGVIAPAYADLTFPVTAGQGCIKDGVRYTAKHDIQTSESWTAAHWEAASVEDSIQGVKSEITSKMDEPESEGTSGQVLTTDGNGGRTWTTVQGGSVDPSAIAGAVDDWCDENITNPSNPPLDRSLLSSSSAAPADLLGDLKDTAAVKVTSPDKTNHSNLGEWNHPVSIKAYGNYSFGNAYIANDSSLCDLDDLTLTQGTVGVSIKPLSNGAFILNGQATGVTIGTAVYIPSDSHRLQVVGEKLVARVYTTKKIRLLIRDKHTSGRTELKDTTISTLNSLVTVTITTAITANPAGIDIAFCTTSGTEFSNDLVWVGLYHEGTTITDLGSVPPVTVNDNTNQNMNTLLYPSSVQYIMETKKYADNKFTYITPEAFYGEAIPEYIDAQTYISQAISYAVANNLMVYCGGSYKISTPITITDNNVAIKINKLIYDGNNYAIRLTGKHCRVEIRYLESSADGFQFAGTSDSSVDASHNNLVIDYAKCVGDVIRFISINDEQLVAGKNSYNYIHITRAWSTTGSIINLEFNSGSGENRIYGCYVRTDSNYAIKSSRASQYFYNFKFEADAYSGIYLESPTGTILQNNKFIDCRTIECEDAVLQDNTHTRKFCKIVGTWNYVSFAVTDGDPGPRPTSIDISDYVAPSENAMLGDSYGYWAYVQKPVITCRRISGAIRTYYQDQTNYQAQCGDWYYNCEKKLIMKDKGCTCVDITDSTVDMNYRDQGSMLDIKANSTVTLSPSYCADGINELYVKQSDGYTATIIDSAGNTIFNGASKGNGLYLIKLFAKKNAAYTPVSTTLYCYMLGRTSEAVVIDLEHST